MAYRLIVSIVLIVAIAAACRCDNDSKTIDPVSTTYEPKFREDGQLWFLDESGKDTNLRITIEVAMTEEEIQYGMMYRRSMDELKGMLFLMKSERPQSFWMKNTYIPLDIIYINSQLRIVSIQKDAEPLSETSLPSFEPALYVLEVNGGFCDRHNVKVGDKVYFEHRRQ